MKIFSRRPGQMREQCALRLITGLNPQVNPIRAAAATILFCIFVTPRRLNKPYLVTSRLPAELLSLLDAHAVNCPLKFFATNPYDVVGASFRCPGPAVINFNPATWQTTSRKRRYPNPMYTFSYGYRCARLSGIEVKWRRLTWFRPRIIYGSLQGPIHNQCHSVSARRETVENVTTVLICFNGREQPAAILRFNSNVHAFYGMSLAILNDTFDHGVRGRRACDEKHDPNESNRN